MKTSQMDQLIKKGNSVNFQDTAYNQTFTGTPVERKLRSRITTIIYHDDRLNKLTQGLFDCRNLMVDA